MTAMRHKKIASVLVGLLAVGLASGCGTVQSPVRVFAGKTELQKLAGDWFGEYVSATTGRQGYISFSLKAGTDSAYGSIVMMAPQMEERNQPFLYNDEPRFSLKPVRILTMNFVVVDGNHVRGTLEPYLDLQCNCTVSTIFDGLLQGDDIAGTYTSMGSSTGTVTNGIWNVKRRKSSNDLVNNMEELPN